VNARRLQFFFAASFFFPVSAIADLSIGQIYPLTFTDVDGNRLSTGDGRVTTVVLTTQSEVDRARAVGERTPDHCLGNPKCQMSTVITFEKKHSRPLRAFLNAMVRRRVEDEAQQLQKRYDRLKVARNARQDVHAVADFNGAIASELGESNDANIFRVFVFGPGGELRQQWSELPAAEELAAALK
jgi:hypothetical protein